MGGQRVFSAVLITIVIGIAAILAINWLDNLNDHMKIKEVRHDLTSLAQAAQAYALKPEIMGGGGGDFVDMNWSELENIACKVTSPVDTSCVNENGVYTFTYPNDTTLIIYGQPLQMTDSSAIAIATTLRTTEFIHSSVSE